MAVLLIVFSISRPFPAPLFFFSVTLGLCESIKDQLLWDLSFIFKIKHFTEVSLVSRVMMRFLWQQLLDGGGGFTESKWQESCWGWSKGGGQEKI